MEEDASIFVYSVVTGAHEDDHALPMLERVEGMSDEKAEVCELQLSYYVEWSENVIHHGTKLNS